MVALPIVRRYRLTPFKSCVSLKDHTTNNTDVGSERQHYAVRCVRFRDSRDQSARLADEDPGRLASPTGVQVRFLRQNRPKTAKG